MRRERLSSIPKRLPDAINASPSSNFTQIPNDMLRDNRISFKAKGILASLLSNRKGWTSYLEGLKNFTNDGEASIRSGMKELTKAGYLIYLVYRDKKNSHVCGSFISYTTIPFKFDLMEHYLWAEENDMKIGFHPRQTEAESLFSGNINIGKVSLGNLVLENKSLIILNNKNTNFKEYQIPPAMEGVEHSTKSEELPKPPSKAERAKQYLPLANKLSRIISSSKNIKHTHQQLTAWSNDICSMVEDHGISTDRISAALNWYRTHVGGSYVPVIESGRALKDKFLKLEAAIARASSPPPQNGNGTCRPRNALYPTQEEREQYAGIKKQVIYVQ